jgi:sulfite reductase (NADPH) hemoprotein beta-component
VPDVVEALIDTYRSHREASERFVDTVRRLGIEPFKASANAVRHATAHAPAYA